MNDTEVWADLPNHIGYEVSDQGRIRSYRNRQGWYQNEPRILTPALVKDYMCVKLGRSRYARMHVLVLETFVGPRPEGAVCRHLDGNPVNNRLENLRWGTLEENYDDRRYHGTDNAGERHPFATVTMDQVLDIRRYADAGMHPRDIAVMFNVGEQCVTHIKYRRSWRSVPEVSCAQ